MLFSPKITIAFIFGLLFLSFTAIDASPSDYEPILNQKGQTAFTVHFYNDKSLFFSKDEAEIIKDGFTYFARILQKPAHGHPPMIGVTKDSVDSKYHGGRLLNLFSGTHKNYTTGDHGLIEIASASVHVGPRSHHIPLQPKEDLRTTVIHELGHGLIGSLSHFHVDTFGGPKAPNVNEVLETTLPGADLQRIPLSWGIHIELDHSLMSHQDYRNYSIFMEAELALLQDLGWSIDRRNFFGYSLYRNDQTVMNSNGYFARTPEGTGYILGTYNQETDGVGLHIYGSRNVLTQKADILTEGTRAVGMRVDGVGNTLIIDKDIKVHANGSDGIGVLFAYRKDHKFILDGELRADGERGVGLSFDLGGHQLGENSHSESSIKAPLATSATIKGFLSGTQKALYMGKSAFVEKIIITPEAQVRGNIISDEKKFAGNASLTSLIFGPEKPTDSVEGQKFIYTGNIQGKNLEVHFTGPYTALYGRWHELYSATIAPGATLSGTSIFTFVSQTGLTNSGTLSPTSGENPLLNRQANIGKMVINGNFRQTDTGKLIIDILKNKTSDLLYVKGEAFLDGTLEIRPERTFYPNDWALTRSFLKANGGIQGNFSKKITTPSPTLTWRFSKLENSYLAAAWPKKENLEASPMTVTKKETFKIAESERTQISTDLHSQKQSRLKNTESKAESKAFKEEYSEHESAEDSLISGIEPSSSKTLVSTDDQLLSDSEKQEGYPNGNDSKDYGVIEEKIEGGRASDAYSQYGRDENEQSVGGVLDRVVDKADAPLQNLYTALDFSSPDGSEVRSALAQLSPVAYGGAFGASLKREHQISDTLNERPSVSVAPGQWQFFALPFLSQTSSKAHNLQVGMSTRTSPGLIVGIEQQMRSKPGLTWGVHGVVGNKASLTFITADKARGSLQAWGLGLHGRYEPQAFSGLYLSAQIRMGLEKGTLTRTLAVNTYQGEQQGKWQGLTATASFVGGTLWKVNNSVSVGPLLGLDYTQLSHAHIEEKSLSGLPITLEKNCHHSLQSSVGGRVVVALNQKMKADIQARWDRELLTPTITQRGRFANTPDSTFYTQTRLGPRDGLNVSGQATYDVSPAVTLGARASAQFARAQKPDFIGNLSLTVKF